MNKLRYVLIVVTLCLLPAQASTQESLSFDKFAQEIMTIMEDDQTPPRDSISALDEILSTDPKHLSIHNIVDANVLKAELLIYLEEIDLAGKIATKYLPIAADNNFETLLVRLKLVELAVHDKNGYSAATEQKITSLLEHANKFESSIAQGDIFIGIGHSRYLSGNLDEALEMFQKAYDIYAKYNDVSNLSFALNSLANLYSDLNDLDTAIEYLIEAVEIKRKLQDEMSVSIMLYNLGMSYIENNEFSAALKALTESLQISIELEDTVGVLWTKQAIADIRLKQGRTAEAIEFFVETERHFAETGDKRMQYEAVKGLFDGYFLLEDMQNAVIAHAKLPALLETLNSNAYDADFLRRSALLASASNDHIKAYELQVQYSKARTELFELEKKQDIQKQRVKFDSAIKDNKNQILRRDNELKTLRIAQHERRNQLWLVIIISALAFTALIAFFLYRQTVNKNLFKSMALRDHLTNSPNRRAILDKAETIWQRASANKGSISIAIVDLDYFKKINDIYGHDVGDEVLKAFALCCKTSLRKCDHFGRYGGEEWLFVMENNDEDEIKVIFQRLHQALNKAPISGYPKEKSINFSVGLAQLSTDKILQLKSLISEADQYLYDAKNSGRNRLVSKNCSYPFSSAP